MFEISYSSKIKVIERKSKFCFQRDGWQKRCETYFTHRKNPFKNIYLKMLGINGRSHLRVLIVRVYSNFLNNNIFLP